MILHLHLLPPIGEVTRREILRAVELVRLDNIYWITSRLNAGFYVPCCPLAAGVEYREPTAQEKKTAEQSFWSGPFMFDQGWGSCGDINAYKAAALTAIYGISTRMLTPAQASTSYHVDYLTPWGPEDETQNYRQRRCRCPAYHPTLAQALDRRAA